MYTKLYGITPDFHDSKEVICDVSEVGIAAIFEVGGELLQVGSRIQGWAHVSNSRVCDGVEEGGEEATFNKKGWEESVNVMGEVAVESRKFWWRGKWKVENWEGEIFVIDGLQRRELLREGREVSAMDCEY